MRRTQQPQQIQNKVRLVGTLILTFLFVVVSIWLYTLRVHPTDAVAPPNIIPFQGKLTDDERITIADGSYSMAFALYDASAGGTCLWSAANTDATTSTIDCAGDTPDGTISVSVLDGIFALNFGDTAGGQNTIPDDLFDNESAVYLGITISPDAEMTPRIRLGSDPYALNSDALDGFETSQAGGTDIVVVTDSSGNINQAGNILPTTTDTYNLGSDTLRWEDVYVGPDTIFVGTGTGDQGSISYDTGTNDFILTAEGGSDIILMQGGSGTLFVTDTFKVGINQSSPDRELHVVTGGLTPTSADVAIIAEMANLSGVGAAGLTTGYQMQLEDDAGANIISGNIFSILTDASTGATDTAMTFETMIGGTLAERMRIDGEGELGLGTTTPDANFDIESTDDDEFIRFTSAGDSVGLYSGDADPNGSVSAEAGSLFLRTSGITYVNTDGGTTWTDLAAGGGGGVDNFDEVYAESITDANLTMEIDNSGGLIYNLTTTGDFVLQDNGSPFATFGNDGNIAFENDVDLGSSSADNISIVGQVDSSIVPDATDTFDLGSDSLRWQDAYLAGDTLHIGASSTDEGTIAYNATSDIFQFGTDGTTDGDIAFFTDDLYLDKSSGFVGIGTTAPDGTFEIATTAASDPIVLLRDADTDHGMTTTIDTDVIGQITSADSTDGGLSIEGFIEDPSSAIGAVRIWGAVGDNNNSFPAIVLRSAQESGTARANSAENRRHTQWQNNDASAIMTLQAGGYLSLGEDDANPNAYLTITGTNQVLSTGETGSLAEFSGTIGEASGGNHALISGLEITAPTISADTATVSNTASLYVSGAPSATVTGDNYAVYVDGGESRFDGVIEVQSAEDAQFFRLQDTTNTDSVSIYTGNDDPDGSLSAEAGSLFLDQSGQTWVNTDGGTSWTDLAAGGGGGADNFDEVYAESITDANLVMEIDNAGGLAFNMTSTGDFAIQDGGTSIATFDSDGDITFGDSGTPTNIVVESSESTGNIIEINSAALTSGSVFEYNSGSDTLTTGKVFDITAEHAVSEQTPWQGNTFATINSAIGDTFGTTSTGTEFTWQNTTGAGVSMTEHVLAVTNENSTSSTDVTIDSLLYLDNEDDTGDGANVVVTNALNIDSTGTAGLTNDINLQNEEIIRNSTDGVIDLVATTVAPSGRLDLAAHANGIGLNIPTNAGAPSAITGTAEGDIVWDSTNDAFYVYDGSAFVTVGGGASENLDDAYNNFGGGSELITVDSGQLDWNVSNGSEFILQDAGADTFVFDADANTTASDSVIDITSTTTSDLVRLISADMTFEPTASGREAVTAYFEADSPTATFNLDALTAIQAVARQNGDDGSTIADLIGLNVQVINSGLDGPVTEAFGVLAQPIISDDSDIASYYAFFANDTSDTSTGEVTDFYGFAVDDLTAGTVSTDEAYAFYYYGSGGTDPFAVTEDTQVGIGTETPDADLDIERTTQNDEFIRLSETSGTADSVGIYSGPTDPNGATSAEAGSIFLDQSGQLWVNTDGATAWTDLAAGGGADTLDDAYDNYGGGTETVTIDSGVLTWDLDAAADDFVVQDAGDGALATFAGDGIITFGGDTSDDIIFTGLVDSNIIPDDDDTYDLGSNSARWQDVYVGPSTVHVGTSTTDEGTIAYNTTSNIFEFDTDATTDGDIAFFSDDLYLDKSEAQIGIGTTTPQADLQIEAASDNEFIRFGISGDNLGIYAGSASPDSSVSAQQGSLFMRSNGELWVNNNGSNGWTQFSTGASGTPNFDEVYAESITDANLIMEIDNTAGLTYNLTTTGDFTLTDNGTPFATFGNDGNIAFENDVDLGSSTADTLSANGQWDTPLSPTSGASGTVDLGGTSNRWDDLFAERIDLDDNSTTTAEIIEVDATALTTGSIFQSISDHTVPFLGTAEVFDIELTNDTSAGSTAFTGFDIEYNLDGSGGTTDYLMNLGVAAQSGNTNTVDAILRLENNDTSTSGTVDVTDAIVVDSSSAGITNAYNVDAASGIFISNAFAVTDGASTGINFNFASARADMTNDFILQNGAIIDNDGTDILQLAETTIELDPAATTGAGIVINNSTLTSGRLFDIDATAVTNGSIMDVVVTHDIPNASTSCTFCYDITNDANGGSTSMNVIDIDYTKSSASGTDYILDIDVAGQSSTSSTIEALIRLDNSDTVSAGTTAVTDAIVVDSNNAGITNAYNVNAASGAFITNAFSVSDGAITGINFNNASAASDMVNDFVLQNGAIIDNDSTNILQLTETTIDLDPSATTGSGVTISNSTVTSGTVLDIDATAITTGEVLAIDADHDILNGNVGCTLCFDISNDTSGGSTELNVIDIDYVKTSAQGVDRLISVVVEGQSNPTSTIESLLYLDNQDTVASGTTAVTDAITVAANNAGITNAYNVDEAAGAFITNAFSVSDGAVTGINFSNGAATDMVNDFVLQNGAVIDNDSTTILQLSETTIDLDPSNATGSGITISDATTTSGVLLDIDATAITTGEVIAIDANHNIGNGNVGCTLCFDISNDTGGGSTEMNVIDIDYTKTSSMGVDRLISVVVEGQTSTSSTIESLLYLDNQDTVTTGTTAVTDGVTVAANSAGITNAFNVNEASGVFITNGFVITDGVGTGINFNNASAASDMTNDFVLQNGAVIDNDSTTILQLSETTIDLDPSNATGSGITISDATTTSGTLLDIDATALTNGEAITIDSTTIVPNGNLGDVIQINAQNNTSGGSTTYNIIDIGYDFGGTTGGTERLVQLEVEAQTSTATVESLLYLNNADTTTSGTVDVTDAITIDSSTAGITNAINITSTNITNDFVMQNGAIIDNDTNGTVGVSERMFIEDNVADYALEVFNDGNAVSRDGIKVQACADSSNYSSNCKYLGVFDGDGDIIGAIEGDDSTGITYASPASDYAELFPGTKADFGQGNILGIGADGNVALASDSVEPIGAYSVAPAIVGNWQDGWTGIPTVVPVGLLGQLDVNVSDENGLINAGDKIAVSSSTPGAGMKMTKTGVAVGIALEDAQAGADQIRVYVKPSWNAGTLMALEAMGEATAVETGKASEALSFRGSGWDTVTASALEQVMTMNLEVDDAESYRLSIKDTTDAEVAYISEEGSLNLAGDIVLAGKIYPSDQGVAQTDKYIYYDGSAGPGGDFMRTNASGWSTGSYDFAEMFPSTNELEAGDVVTFALSDNEHVQRSNGTTYDPKIAGIVSTKPGFLAGENIEGHFPIALAGRVPTKVSDENGSIEIGDPLTTSSTPGFAMKATEPGMIIGYALEPYSGETDESIIVFVNATYFNGGVGEETPGTQNTASGFASTGGSGFSSLDMYGPIYMHTNNIVEIGKLVGVGNVWSVDELGVFSTEASFDVLIKDYQGELERTHALLTMEQKIFLSGSTTLDAGRASVNFEDIDPAFNDVTSTTAPLQVVVSANGPAYVYVSNKDHNGFTIEQLEGSSSGIEIDWYVTAYRKDFDPDLEEEEETEEPAEEEEEETTEEETDPVEEENTDPTEEESTDPTEEETVDPIEEETPVEEEETTDPVEEETPTEEEITEEPSEEETSTDPVEETTDQTDENQV